jgi:O-antigen ligase
LSLLLLALILSILFTVTSLNAAAIQDLTHYARLIYFIVFVVLIAAPWANSDPQFHKRLPGLLLWSSIPMAMVFALQMFPIDGVSNLIYWLYGDVKLRSYTSSSPRVYGTFYNANWVGVYLMACWVSLFSLWLRKDIKIFSVCCIGTLLLFMTIATGSRTALIGSAIALVWLLMFWFVFGGARSRIFSFAMVGLTFSVMLGALIWTGSDLPFWSRYSELFSGGLINVKSFASRIDHWHAGINHFLQSPVIGPGVKSIPHNSYIAWLQSFGLIGFTAVLFFLFASLWRWIYLGAAFEVMFSSSVFVGFMAMSFTSEFFFTTQVMLLIIPIITGVFFVSKKNLCNGPPNCQRSNLGIACRLRPRSSRG